MTIETIEELSTELTDMKESIDFCIDKLDKPHSNYVHCAVGKLKTLSVQMDEIINRLNQNN